MQVFPELFEQFTQVNDLGDCVQLAVRIVVPPTYGFEGSAASVQTGGPVGGTCHVTVAAAGEETPAELRA